MLPSTLPEHIMTETIEYPPIGLSHDHPRRQLRDLTREEFIDKFGSGTLRKSARLGFYVQDAYLRERAQVEFGYGFEVVARSRVTYSDIRLVPGAPLTELGWHAERMIEMRPFEEDEFFCKQFEVEYADGKKREGAGILVWKTSAGWIPPGQMVLAIVAERVNGEYLGAINPF
jgi:hypothetical protein